MFSENLKTIRKEKGLSVPDADMLIKISEAFDISVSELLGAKVESETNQSDMADQLSRINEQLAIKNRRGKFILRLVG